MEEKMMWMHGKLEDIMEPDKVMGIKLRCAMAGKPNELEILNKNIIGEWTGEDLGEALRMPEKTKTSIDNIGKDTGKTYAQVERGWAQLAEKFRVAFATGEDKMEETLKKNKMGSLSDFEAKIKNSESKVPLTENETALLLIQRNKENGKKRLKVAREIMNRCAR